MKANPDQIKALIVGATRLEARLLELAADVGEATPATSYTDDILSALKTMMRVSKRSDDLLKIAAHYPELREDVDKYRKYFTQFSLLAKTVADDLEEPN